MKRALDPIYQTISDLEQYMNENAIIHRFVGGVSYAGLLLPDSEYEIDILHQSVSFKQEKPLSLLREDGTVRDVDIIIFCAEPKKIARLNAYVTTLRNTAQKEKALFPIISIENAIYAHQGRRNKLLQFVTALEIDGREDFGEGGIYLVFEDISQRISWKTLEPWTIHLKNGISYTVRNPIADHFAYFFRSPSGLKPKDEEKIKYLKRLAQDTIKEGNKFHINYDSDDYYKPWERYIVTLTHSTNPSTQTKANLTRWYWQTIGTALAHGKGKFGTLLQHLSNQFTGVKQ